MQCIINHANYCETCRPLPSPEFRVPSSDTGEAPPRPPVASHHWSSRPRVTSQGVLYKSGQGGSRRHGRGRSYLLIFSFFTALRTMASNSLGLPRDSSPFALRLSVEALVGITTAFAVAPFVSIIDKAIVSNASRVEPLLPCIIAGTKYLATKPLGFFRQPSFLWIWGVYSGTYIAKNWIQAACERVSVDNTIPTFVGSSAANISLSTAKDRAFVRMFGAGVTRSVPLMSLGIFAARDSMTILASFSLPPVLSSKIQHEWGVSRPKADFFAQLIAPVGMQVISTPLHLLGLDLYNRSQASLLERRTFISQEYVKTALARMARILPAFGIGGVVNTNLRDAALSRIFCFYLE